MKFWFVNRNSQYVDEEVDQKIIDMLLYSMEEGRELVCLESGNGTLLGTIATSVLMKFVSAVSFLLSNTEQS